MFDKYNDSTKNIWVFYIKEQAWVSTEYIPEPKICTWVYVQALY